MRKLPALLDEQMLVAEHLIREIARARGSRGVPHPIGQLLTWQHSGLLGWSTMSLRYLGRHPPLRASFAAVRDLAIETRAEGAILICTSDALSGECATRIYGQVRDASVVAHHAQQEWKGRIGPFFRTPLVDPSLELLPTHTSFH